jgi:hypothetical protein|tara:strand:- start:99 stop:593 length:495 start_codon:yes stop_codon:yes gene_type:complete
MLKVNKNFLDKNIFNEMKKIIFSDNFSWYFQESVTDNITKKRDGFFFSHRLYDNDEINSNYFSQIVNPLKEKIKYQSLRRCTINLFTQTTKSISCNFHTDFNDDRLTTGIFYFNKTDGITEFKNNKKIKSEPNTFVEFSSNLKHRGFTPTNKIRRVVLNINYYK